MARLVKQREIEDEDDSVPDIPSTFRTGRRSSQEDFEATEDQQFVHRIKMFNSMNQSQFSNLSQGANEDSAIEKRNFFVAPVQEDQTSDSYEKSLQKRKQDRQQHRLVRQRGSLNDYEDNQDQAWVQRIQSFNSMTGQQVKKVSKGVQPMAMHHEIQEEAEEDEDFVSEAPPRPVPKRSHGPMVRRDTLQLWRESGIKNGRLQAVNSQEQNRPSVPKSPLDFQSIKSTSGTLATLNEPMQENVDFDANEAEDDVPNNSDQIHIPDNIHNRKNTHQKPKNGRGHVRRSTLDMWKEQVKLMQSRDVPAFPPHRSECSVGGTSQRSLPRTNGHSKTFQKLSSNTATREAPVQRDAASSTNEDAAPEPRRPLVRQPSLNEQVSEIAAKHKRQETLQEWKHQAHIERERERIEAEQSQHQAQHPAAPARTFEQIDDQQWTRNIQLQDTLKRHKKHAPIPVNMFEPLPDENEAITENEWENASQTSEHSSKATSTVTNLSRTPSLLAESLPGNTTHPHLQIDAGAASDSEMEVHRHDSTSTLDGWRARKAETSDPRERVHTPMSFQTIGDQMWTDEIVRRDTMQTRKQDTQVLSRAHSVRTVQEQDEDSMSQSELRELLKRLLSAISGLWCRGAINLEQKTVLKQLSIVRHPAVLEAANIHFYDNVALENLLEKMVKDMQIDP